MGKQDNIPDGLHSMQYAAEILENQLGWPLKTNGELMADCIKSIQRTKTLTAKQAHAYMTRAIKLAKDQRIEINRLFFMNGDYMNIRPATKEAHRTYKPIDRKALEEHQATKEWQEASDRVRARWAELAGKKAIP